MPGRTRTPLPAQAPPAPGGSVRTPASAVDPPIPATLDEIVEEMSAIAANADTGTLTDEEAGRYEALEAGLAASRRSDEIRARQAAYETPVTYVLPAGGSGDGVPRNPVAFTREAADAIVAAIKARRPGRFAAGGSGVDEFTNATLTTSTYGQPAEWSAAVLSGPRILHRVAGVAREQVDAALVEFPALTLPTGVAGVGEGVTLGEYATSTGGVATLVRHGRWTDVTAESKLGTSPAALIAQHQLAIAFGLDLALIAAVETAAADFTFIADVQANVRRAIATVIANTAVEDAADLVILVHPDNAALLQDISPVSGSGIGEGFQRFSGAIVYPSVSVTTAFMTVANLRAGALYFEAQAAVTETDLAVKTGVTSMATSLIGGYGLGLAAGFAVQVDVVTP